MRERRMDRFVILPFSVGCVSQSSVAVCENQPKRARAEAAAAPPTPSGKPRNSFSVVLPFPRPTSIAAGFQKLARSIKSLSHYFAFEEEEEEEEAEMEIGFPTDVQHVAHIGLDGLSHTMGSKKSSWDMAPPEFLPLPSFSMKQLELAMAAQAGAPPPPPPPPHGPHGSWLH